ncbi:hypothetical protein DFP73DRAFT_75213 [Morchella snyderi]|nr:hypothetical protein DFP73DRAFT_75213 [Morchella snyderi]
MAQNTHTDHYTVLTNNTLTKDITLFIGLVIPSVLDISKLKNAHEELVKHWPILGGTLITSTKPYSFTTGTTIDFQSRILPTTLAATLPFDFHTPLTASAPSPTLHAHAGGDPKDAVFHFDSMRPMNKLPATLFALRVTLLQDATLLGFRVPHHLVDGKGMFEIVSAYATTLSRGTESLPQLVLPLDVHVLRGNGSEGVKLSELVEGKDDLPETVKEGARFVDPRENFTTGLWSLVKFIVRLLVNQVLRPMVGLGEKGEDRYVHVSGACIEDWVKRCQVELDKAAERGELEEGAGLRLTRNDVLSAYWLKAGHAALKPDNGPIDLMYNLNYRPHLRSASPGTTYLHNSYYNIRANFPSFSAFQKLPLSRLALEIRLCVLRNKQPSAVRKTLQFMEDTVDKVLSPGVPGGRPDFLPFLSSWTTFEYNRLDFSGACEKGQEGRVEFTHAYCAFPGGIDIRPFGVTLKDGKGGYWIRTWLEKRAWEGHEKAWEF